MEKPSPPVGQTQMARVPMPTVRLQDVGKPDDDEGGSGGGGGGGNNSGGSSGLGGGAKAKVLI